jgi:hypothetical protein
MAPQVPVPCQSDWIVDLAQVKEIASVRPFGDK